MHRHAQVTWKVCTEWMTLVSRRVLLVQQTRNVVTISLVTATTVIIVTIWIVISTILVCLGCINKTFCWGNNVRAQNIHGKNGFVKATKIGTTNKFFVAATKSFAAATKRFVDRTKHFVVVTKYFCYPYFNKWFCWYNKTFYTVYKLQSNPLLECKDVSLTAYLERKK